MSSSQTPNSRLWALIVAAGRGERTGGDQPKQYHQLAGRMVLDWSLQALLQTPNLQGLMLVVAAGDTAWRQCQWASDPRLKTATGGAERCESVVAGLQALKRDCGAENGDWVLVHDAARPAITPSDIKKLIEAVNGNPNGGLLAAPVRDTLKRAGSDGNVAETVNRNGLWQAMTPQLFPLAHLLTALCSDQATPPTDEAQAMERAGWQPQLVPGSPQNIKYTYQEDLAWLAHLLANKAGAKT